MSKVDGGIPVDPDAWLANLATDLIPIGRLYALVAAGPTESDRERAEREDVDLSEENLRWAKTDLAGKSVRMIVSALADIPGLEASGALDPLRDIMVAFGNLSAGLSPDLFKPRPSSTRGQDYIENHEVRWRMVAAVYLMQRLRSKFTLSLTDKSIYHFVADEFSFAANATLGMSSSALRGWCRSDSATYRTYKPLIENTLSEIAGQPDWPFGEPKARQCVKALAYSVRPISKRS